MDKPARQYPGYQKYLDNIILAVDADGGTYPEKADRINAMELLTKTGATFTGNYFRISVGKINKRQGKRL